MERHLPAFFCCLLIPVRPERRLLLVRILALFEGDQGSSPDWHAPFTAVRMLTHYRKCAAVTDSFNFLLIWRLLYTIIALLRAWPFCSTEAIAVRNTKLLPHRGTERVSPYFLLKVPSLNLSRLLDWGVSVFTAGCYLTICHQSSVSHKLSVSLRLSTNHWML